MTTEQTATHTLEDVLEKGLSSEETEEVSEATEDKLDEATETKDAKVETGEEEETLTPENFDKRVQSETDKITNKYREKREADTALIRSLQTKVRELSVDNSSKHLSKLMDTIIAGEEEEGLDDDKIEAQKQSFKEIKGLFKTYDENIAKVQEASESIDIMIEQLQDDVVKNFSLDDPNPMVRAANGAQLVSDAVYFIKQKSDFMLTLENFLPRGDELREKIDSIVQELAECKSKREKELLLKERLQGVKVSRRKPPSPSGTSGGGDELRGDDAILAGLEEEQKKLRR